MRGPQYLVKVSEGERSQLKFEEDVSVKEINAQSAEILKLSESEGISQ